MFLSCCSLRLEDYRYPEPTPAQLEQQRRLLASLIAAPHPAASTPVGQQLGQQQEKKQPGQPAAVVPGAAVELGGGLAAGLHEIFGEGILHEEGGADLQLLGEPSMSQALSDEWLIWPFDASAGSSMEADRDALGLGGAGASAPSQTYLKLNYIAAAEAANSVLGSRIH